MYPYCGHDELVNKVFLICKSLGFETYKEYRGNGWRADVFIVKGNKKIAIEVQLTRQSPKVLWKRQNLYLRDNIEGCWLILNPYKKLEEHIDLPIFYISSKDPIKISLVDKRKEVVISDFLKEFLNDGIKFCNKAKTHDNQKIRIIFFEMECWKCGAINHIYYVTNCYRSSCNLPIHDEISSMLWSGNNFEFEPEIIEIVRKYLNTDEGKDLHVGEIKQRYSKTVRSRYKSFGCYKCDSLFGDSFVNEKSFFASAYGDNVSRIFETTIKPQKTLTINLPHWCFPDDKNFCE